VRAVAPREVVVESAEIRLDDEYRFFRTGTSEARRDLD
jgi:hypothetical protein